MEDFVKECLNQIDQAAQTIKNAVHTIIGFCNGVDTVARNYPREQEVKENLIQLIDGE